MIPLGQQVSSLESSKWLKELGCPQESLFYWKTWIDILDGAKERIVYRDYVSNKFSNIESDYSAYTSSELGQMLPDSIIGNKYISESLTFDKWRNQWLCCYGGIDDKNYYPTLVETMAKMLIHLLENGLCEVPK